MTPWSTKYKRRTRRATLDKAPQNGVAEAIIREARKPKEWLPFRINCRTHVASTCHKHTFSFWSSAIQGIINVALSIQQQGCFEVFRKCLRAEIRLRMRVRVGTAPPSAVLYKRRVLRMFCSVGPSVEARRLVSLVLSNGDWQNRINIEV